MNIIVVSGAHGPRPDLDAGLAATDLRGTWPLTLFLAFTLLFNYLTCATRQRSITRSCRRYSLADQREEALKAQEIVQGHLNAMAVRLGELQAQMLRLDGLGEHASRRWQASSRTTCRRRLNRARRRVEAARRRPCRGT